MRLIGCCGGRQTMFKKSQDLMKKASMQAESKREFVVAWRGLINPEVLEPYWNDKWGAPKYPPPGFMPTLCKNWWQAYENAFDAGDLSDEQEQNAEKAGFAHVDNQLNRPTYIMFFLGAFPTTTSPKRRVRNLMKIIECYFICNSFGPQASQPFIFGGVIVWAAQRQNCV